MLESDLLPIAAALDAEDTAMARWRLSTLAKEPGTPLLRRLIISFWRRSISIQREREEITSSDTETVLAFLDTCETSLERSDVWPVYSKLSDTEDAVGPAELAGMVLSIFWDALPDYPDGFQYEIFSRVFLGGTFDQHLALWKHLLKSNTEFVPDYWQFQSLAKSWAGTRAGDTEQNWRQLLELTERADLLPLFEIYQIFLSQRDPEKGFSLARGLTELNHRHRIVQHLLGASQTNAILPLAVDLHADLCDDTAEHESRFMGARLAVLRKDWRRVIELTRNLVRHPDLRHESISLRALAHAHLGNDDLAKNAVDHVRSGLHASWFLSGRAALIGVTRRLIRDGLPLPNDKPVSPQNVRCGRPLAQSLWIGTRLRWIEELSIRSFLQNGWRYQLYVYDYPENVPDGVEVLDAGAILPSSVFFAEGPGSGLHAGSIGAFSDLFRYALLEKRGGMWTDTDVINLDLFEPDGCRFISTEFNDAGVVGVNGAMMAAPAGDHLQRTAFLRARQILDAGTLYFARIGPQLIAELLGDIGLDGYQLMPTYFLNPIGWMETGRLLGDFDSLSREPQIDQATNIHVYTETWRLIGLSLDSPPDTGSFLGTLYSRLLNEESRSSRSTRSLLRH